MTEEVDLLVVESRLVGGLVLSGALPRRALSMRLATFARVGVRGGAVRWPTWRG